jgi:type VI protein secretion system component Hcp
MAKGDHSDLFMIIRGADGNLIDGESQAELTSDDPISQTLLDGLDPKKVFELDSFTLSAEADDQSESEIRAELTKQNQHSGPVKPGTKSTPPMSQRQIEQAVADRLKAQKGPPVRAISFSRAVDRSSAFFLSNIAIGKGYKSASLIKRKATGGMTPEQTAVVGDVYLRIDFDYVLITEVSWQDDDDEVKEDCKFICRKISIQYRPQLPDGTLGAIIPGGWEWTPSSP